MQKVIKKWLTPLTLTIVFVLSFSIAVPVSAELNDTSPNSSQYSVDGYTKAETYRLEAITLAEKGIEKLASQSRPMRLDTVYLGTDRTFYDANWGIYWSEQYGTPTDELHSQSYLEDNQAEALVDYNLGGGGAGIAWVGNQFTVSGSGSQYATISMSGNYTGSIFTAAVFGGSSGVDIVLVVKDDTTGLVSPLNILNTSTGFGDFEWDQNFNYGMVVNLQANHSYSVYISLTASCGLVGAGFVTSDWGRWDDIGEHVNYSYISIDF
jgi:hypothetical protein